MRFEFEETPRHYVMNVIAPPEACDTAAVRAVLENFAGMPERPAE